MYNRGTLEEFNIWHNLVMTMENISSPEGKIGFVNGIPAPQNQKTIAYSSAIKNPNELDDYIWAYGAYPNENNQALSMADVMALGWFSDSL